MMASSSVSPPTAAPELEVQLAPMQPGDLDAVYAVELTAYESPWSRRNFEDVLHSGYHAQMLTAGPRLLGYFVAMRGVDEVHLLNMTVASAFRGQGWARLLLDALDLWARGQGAQWAWLEVRVSNLRAQHVYQAHGYRTAGVRKAYYPAVGGVREDALVMCSAVGVPKEPDHGTR